MNRIPSSAQSSDFGLIAWLEETRISLPLKGVECQFEITGSVACVQLDQIYHQNAARPLDCCYTFPLPAGAAVYRCEVHINGRVIRAKVEQKDAARIIFQEQKMAGRRVAMVESERENVFTLTLGNVQPGDLVVVRFAWFQSLDRAANGLRLLVPTCPGVRYIPGKPLIRSSSGRGTVDDTDQVPDASRITPPRIDALHPDAAYFSIEGKLTTGDAEGRTISSPSHPIYVREADGGIQVELSGRGAIPDRDFVLAWREPKARQLAPQSWRWTDRGETYALVQLRAPAEVKEAADFPQDFYFLVDRSGSMEGAKWQRSCEALHAFVRLLGKGDRVWITLFESSYQDFAEAPKLAAEVLADRGFHHLAALGVAGGTNLLPAALHILQKIAAHSAERRANVILITDGEVGNDVTIVEAFRRVPRVRVHTFGIDTTVNDAFLKSLAAQQRGGCWLQTPNDDIAGTVAALGSRLRRPVITDLAVEGSWEAGNDMWPDLHADETVSVTLRGDFPDAVVFTGRLPDGLPHRLTVALDRAGSEGVRLLWARDRIAHLLSTDRRAEALQLARWHNLICDGAAFIAWDEAEKVAIATETIVQMVQMPAYLHAKLSELTQLRRQPEMPGGLSSPVRQRRFDSEPRACYAPLSPRMVEAEASSDLVSGYCRILESGAAQMGAIIRWATEKPKKSHARAEAFGAVARVLIKTRDGFASEATKDLFAVAIQTVLRGVPRTEAADLNALRKDLGRIERVKEAFAVQHVPAEVVEALSVWLLERGEIHSERLEKLEEVLSESTWRRFFSAKDPSQKWRRFMESSLEPGSPAHSAVMQWLRGELAGKV